MVDRGFFSILSLLFFSLEYRIEYIEFYFIVQMITMQFFYDVKRKYVDNQ